MLELLVKTKTTQNLRTDIFLSWQVFNCLGGCMIIQKILNNNAVITFDDQGREIVAMGKGLAYGKRNGDHFDENDVIKIFKLSGDDKNIFEQLLNKIPQEYFDLSQMIIDYAQCKLDVELDDSIYIRLTDHLNSAVGRAQQGLYLKNKLQWEISQFYPKEFQIGLHSLHIIEASLGEKLPEDEAGFIAMHIITSESGDDITTFYDLTAFIQEMRNIVRYHFNIDFDSTSLEYSRFIVHLKFFGTRILSGKPKADVKRIKNNLLDIIKERYLEPYRCSLKIKEYIESYYNYFLDDDEILYLTIHIARVVEGGGEEQ